MEAIEDIFRVNEVTVYFAYGQVFFVLGLIIALRAAKHSRLALAGHLKWLAAFGIVHGVYEWGHAFIPVQAAYLSSDVIDDLKILRTFLLVLSFYLLMQFGVLLSFPRLRHNWLVSLIPFGLLVAWLVFSVIARTVVVDGLAVAVRLPRAAELTRLILGFSGAALAGYGMLRQARIVEKMGFARIGWYFRWSAFCFAFYAIVAGLLASRGEWIIGALWNVPVLGGLAQIPAPILRSVAGLGIVVGILRGQGIFQLEADKLIEERHELQRKEGMRDQLFARVMTAQEEERKRVARELHDETGQGLSAVIMGLGAARKAMPPEATTARAILEDTRDIAVHALEGVRQITLGLRPSLLDDLGLAPALRRVAEDLTKRSTVEIEVSADGVDDRLPAQVETVLFRILQEGMTNVVRHSRAQRALLRVTRTETEVRAVLEDNGIGFDPIEATAHLDSGCGLGLMGMRERALMLGGTVTIDSSPGSGTRLGVRLALAERT